MNQQHSLVKFAAAKNLDSMRQSLPSSFILRLEFTGAEIIFEILKMCAIFQLLWVRKLIGKLGVPYNRRLRVRGSPHPFQQRNYDAVLPPCADESNDFRIQSDLPCPERRIAPLIVCASSGETLACIKIPRNLAFGTFGLPIFGFIKILCV